MGLCAILRMNTQNVRQGPCRRSYAVWRKLVENSLHKRIDVRE